MNTILSIDLDILFSPYVGIYNPCIGGASCNQIWQKISHDYYTVPFVANEKYVKIINKIIDIYNKQVSNVYIGFDHSGILTAIEHQKKNFDFPYEFDLYNIDYHHDIFYDQYQSEEIVNNKQAHCGNWVGFLTYYKFIKKYYWYYGEGSFLNEDQLIGINMQAFPNTTRFLLNKNFNKKLNIDLLYLSISPQWIPIDQYKVIKDVIARIPQNKIIFIEEPYFNSHEEKHFLSIDVESSSLEYFNFLKQYNI